MTKKRVIIAIIGVAVIAAGVYFFMPKNSGTSEPQWITSTIEKQSIVQSVTATGTIEPVTLVDVGTQVSGILTTLYVDYNSVVEKGQIIAELDKSTLLLDVNSKKNSVASAKSKYNYELSNYTRTKALYDKGLIADTEYEETLYNYESAKNSYEIAKNDLARSETDLGYATIYSPIDGVIISRSVEEGQTVASSYSTPTLFTVAADLKDMRVIVDVDEADIGYVAEGQKAVFTVDAYPLDKFIGEVTQVRQEAIVESNVTTYEVVISAANPDLKLKPGLTASVEVFILDTECEQTVPVAALSFTPPMPSDGGAPEMDRGAGKGAGRGAASGSTIWIKNGDSIEPVQVTTGVTNGILTEVFGAKVGDEVITGMEAGAKMQAPMGDESSESSPFLPSRPGR